MNSNQRVRVRGTVQGVGFRPTVYRIALECELHGEVFNDADGVLIHLSGPPPRIKDFAHKLKTEAPPLSKIDAIEFENVNEAWQYSSFTISQSDHNAGHTDVTADARTCQACMAEVRDPQERRYLYPFTNCTHCGPRLSIVRGIPYDRASTTMAAFPMCPACAKEYQNPLDRRFHAQPVACHDCGPSLTLYRRQQPLSDVPGIHPTERTSQQLKTIVQALNDGEIVAIKGLGGFHLCCDARNHQAVCLLRERKRRYAKPLALMSHDVDMIAQYCHLSALEHETLRSSEAPIVLLEQRLDHGLPSLSAAISPGSRLFGFMMPYTPLHALICEQFGHPLVMSSGNPSGEPQIIDNAEALDKLSAIADLIVCHNRDIANRIDDSVVRCVAGEVRVIRRARGYAPRSIKLPSGFAAADGLVSYGAELKSTFCIVQQGTAILSQHQGDLENLSTLEDFEKNLKLYQQLYDSRPRALIHDLHPEYLSTKLALEHARQSNLPTYAIQHHHAHVTAAMAENGLPLHTEPVLGIALDGLGYGADDGLWGAEFLLADYTDFQRLASFTPVAMPGGAAATKQPWRNALAHILNSMRWEQFITMYHDTAIARLLLRKPIETLNTMLEKSINCPHASSAGRLFDAVAAAAGLSPEQVYFEGQAAIELEMLTDTTAVVSGTVPQAYPFLIEPLNTPIDAEKNRLEPVLRINPAALWPNLLDDLQQGVTQDMIATRFHAGLIDALMTTVQQLAGRYPFKQVVLSGGCLQNAVLLQGIQQRLNEHRLTCISHSHLPANDGGIALGQAVIAAAKSMTDNKPAATQAPAGENVTLLKHRRKTNAAG